RLLTRAEVARMFQVSPSTVTRWAEAGKLPAVKTLGGHRRYDAEAVMALVQQLTQEEVKPNMEKVVFDVPAMYGDHHVIEVRRILLGMRGVEDVYASSCFHVVEIDYNPQLVSAEELRAALEEAGYMEEIPVPEESGAPAVEENLDGKKPFFRHTAAFEQARQVIGFVQEVEPRQRPLWPCPGFGILKREELEKEMNHG
ncbi:MAG: helix-turn-helix domain-containing protein, partial [Caldilineae bacterium]